MNVVWLGLALGVFASACGVNPDRMAVIEQRKLDIAQKSTGEIELEYSDSDPQAIRDAVAAVNESEKRLSEGDLDGYMSRRYEALSAVGPLASEDVRQHAKTPAIFAKMAQLDGRFGAKGNERSAALLGAAERSNTASADALYAVQDGLDTCARAFASTDRTETEELYRRYESNLDRASSVDGQSLYYIGRKPSGAGLIDVPAEVAFCEARLASKREIWADEPPEAADLSTQFNGCGYFAIPIEAAQTSPNVFAEYQIVGSTSQPAEGTAVACERIPPVSDAPTNVQRPMRDRIMWLASGDIISMAGPFEYEQRETLFKKGVVRVYRTDAPLKTSKSGSEDPNIKCEAEGSELARAFNHAQHYLKRAEVHRLAGLPDKCMEMANKAGEAASAQVTANAENQFLTAEKEVLPYAQISARVEAMKSEATQIASSDWCSKTN